MKAPSETILKKLGLTEAQYLEFQAVRYVDAVQRARTGDWRPYFEFQWPGLVLDTFQEDAIQHVFDPTIHSVWIKGNTGCGKGAVAGLVCAAWLDVWPDALIRNTASTFQQAKDSVFKETVTWMNRMTRNPAEHSTLVIKTDEITDSHPLRREHTMMVANPSSDQAFAGRHAEHSLVILDEATELVESRFDIVNTWAKKILAMGNPRTVSGTFRKNFGFVNPDENQTLPGQYGLKRLITVDGLDTMNVRMKCLRSATAPKGGIVICPKRGDAADIMDNLPPEDWKAEAKKRDGIYVAEGKAVPKKWWPFCKPIIPGQNDYGWFCGIMAHPREFNRMVFGRARFPQQDPEKQVILGSWLERHYDHHKIVRDKITVKAIGVDVGYQEDLPVMIPGDETGILEVAIPSERITTTEKLLVWIKDVCQHRYGINIMDGSVAMAVDMDGPGKGLVDILSNAGAWVIAIQSGSAASDNQRFYNLRAEMYGEFGDRLDPGGTMGHIPFALPYDPMLLDELQWPEKMPVGHDGLKHKLTKKTDIRADKGRSPDRADAAVYFYHAIRQVCDVGSVVAQFDTASFKPDYSWSEGLVTSLDFASSPIAVANGKPVEYDSLRLQRELRALPLMAGFSPERYQAALRRIMNSFPETPEALQAQEMLNGSVQQ